LLGYGGFSVDNATLNRFFSFHYFLPFTILGVMFLHLIVLHQHGSNNPLGFSGNIDKISFYPYFVIKDLFSWLFVFIFYFYFVFFSPNFLGHTDNYIEANAMITPSHIVPEWYFLPFYAILRSIPHKLGGVIAMFASLLVLFLIPFLNFAEIRSPLFRPLCKIFFWVFILDYFILGWIGGCSPETPYLEIGQIGTFFYFFYFIIIIPLLSYLEKIIIAFKN